MTFYNYRLKVGFVALLTAIVFMPLIGPYAVFGETASSEKEGNIKKINSGPSLTELERDPGWAYNSAYLFSITRAVRDADMSEAVKVPIFIPSLVLDAGLLPFALLAGLFG